MKTKLKTKDLIYAGAFAAMYIIAIFIIVMGFGMIPILYLLAPLFVGIVNATIYMMYISKVKKFGAILILAALFGVIMSSAGHIFTILICLPLGLVAELVAKAGNYSSRKMTALSYVVFNLTMVAPFTQLYTAAETFVEEARMYYGDVYADAILNVVNSMGAGFALVQIGCAVAGAVIGMLLAGVLFKKHFQKAGIVK